MKFCCVYYDIDLQNDKQRDGALWNKNDPWKFGKSPMLYVDENFDVFKTKILDIIKKCGIIEKCYIEI